MEYKFAELARAKLDAGDQEPSLHHQVHNKIAPQSQSGMVCSGEQTLFITLLRQEYKNDIARLVASLQSLRNGTLELSFNRICFDEKVPGENFGLSGIVHNALLTVKTGLQNQLLIISAGHCSLALSKIMSNMDFYIMLYNTRPVLNTLDKNHFVHEKIHMVDYSEVGQHIPGREASFVVIITNGYRDDYKALRALILKNFTYLGLLVSKKYTTNFCKFCC